MLNENLKNIVYRDGQLYCIKTKEDFFKELENYLKSGKRYTVIWVSGRSNWILESKFIKELTFFKDKIKFSTEIGNLVLYKESSDLFYVGHSTEHELSYILREDNVEITFEFNI